MSTVRAKVNATKVVDPDGFTRLSFHGVYSNDPASENKAFSDSTPHISVSMTIAAGKPAANMFEDGKTYYLDFSEAPAQ